MVITGYSRKFLFPLTPSTSLRAGLILSPKGRGKGEGVSSGGNIVLLSQFKSLTCKIMLLLGCVFITYLFSLGFVFAEELADSQFNSTQSIGNKVIPQQINPVRNTEALREKSNISNGVNTEQPDFTQHNSAPQFAGEFFGIRVTLQNYYFVKGVISVFGNKWGPQPQSQEELEKAIWDQLLMSFEAFRRGVEINQEEVDEEINKILAAERVEFDWKKDKTSYEKWVKDKTNGSAEVFEGQLKHLIQLQLTH